jgi:hypothetical protein
MKILTPAVDGPVAAVGFASTPGRPAADHPNNRPGVCYRGTVRAALSLGIVLMMVPAVAAGAVDPNPAVAIYDGMATLHLPEGWRAIPPNVLEYFTLRTAEATGGRTAESYQHGFRPGDPDLEFSVPQVLIQIREDGRISYGHFLRLPPIEGVAAQPASPLTDHRGSLLRELQLTGVAFDRERFRLTVDSVMDLSIEGRVVVRSASFLTERGVLTLHCYELEDRIAATAPVFETIIDSVRFDDRIAYRPRLTDQWSSRHTAVALFVLAALLAVAALVARRRLRAGG